METVDDTEELADLYDQLAADREAGDRAVRVMTVETCLITNLS